jgi:enoyl-CoA hydratase/carnithine racemase
MEMIALVEIRQGLHPGFWGSTMTLSKSMTPSKAPLRMKSFSARRIFSLSGV